MIPRNAAMPPMTAGRGNWLAGVGVGVLELALGGPTTVEKGFDESSVPYTATSQYKYSDIV